MECGTMFSWNLLQNSNACSTLAKIMFLVVPYQGHAVELWNHPFVRSKLRSLLSWLIINLTKHPCPCYYYWRQKNHAYGRLKIFWPVRSSSNILFSTGVDKGANSTLPPILPPPFPPPISGSLVTAIYWRGGFCLLVGLQRGRVCACRLCSRLVL